MSYTPEWERLADALSRVVATGLSEHHAKTDLCSAVADKKIHVRVRVAESDRDMSGATCSGDWVSVPAHLKPSDFDWVLSRPLHAWSVGPPVGPWSYSDAYLERKRRQIDFVELATADVQSVFSTSESKPDLAAGEANFNQPPNDGGGSGLELDSSINDRSSRTTKMPPMPPKPGSRQEAWKALKTRYPDGRIPNDLSGALLHKIVNDHIEKLPPDAIEGRIREKISLDTVLRAAGRKK